MDTIVEIRPFIFMDVGASESVALGSDVLATVPYNRVLDSFGITLNATTHAFTKKDMKPNFIP